MAARFRYSLILLMVSVISGCDDAPRFSDAEPGEAQSGGAATVNKRDRNAFSLPSANLSASRRLDFSVGNSFFRNPWVIAPATTTARDGLGPLFNTNACQNCHIKDGRGHPPEPGATNAVSMLVRLSIPDEPGFADPSVVERVRQLGLTPEPVYGTQLQDMAIPGVTPEGKVRIEYDAMTVHFRDGTPAYLRRPTLQITQLGYGPMHPQTRASVRIAPPMIGLGLLEAIPASAILANANPDNGNRNAVSGKPNWVWDDAQQKLVLGRFGWKASQPSVTQQNVHAMAGDMGLTSSLKRMDDCTPSQTACRNAPNGEGPDGEPEVSDNILRLITFYTRNLAVPARRDVSDAQVLAGKNLFFKAGCQQCHTPQFTTSAAAAEPELANQIIRPYTDLLLHDMGEGLADNLSEFQASGREWRTPPLWGIGLTQTVSGHTQYLHDGRARNVMEAVLWHGGEALAAQRQVLAFDESQRSALLAFLNSL